MTDAAGFGSQYVQTVRDLIDAIEAAELMGDRLKAEPGLAAAVAQAMAGSNRSDLTEQVINDAAGAIYQIYFAYESGDPTQKSLLYKVL
jgi:hypothetical protein